MDQHQHLLDEEHEHTPFTTTTTLVEDYDTVDLKGRPINMVVSGRWRAASFIICYEACERMSFFGIAMNLVVYLTEKLHEGTVESARNVDNWRGAIWMPPVLGAYLADTFLGRFSTIAIFSCIYLLGMGLLTTVVSLSSLKPSPCDELSGI